MNEQVDSSSNGGSGDAESAEMKANADVLVARRAFLQITEEDCRRVRDLTPAFRAFADEFVERFYAHLFSFPGTAAFLDNPEQIHRLKAFQRGYFDSLLKADLRPEYVNQRRCIGRTHAEVGLEPQWFLGAFNQYVQHCFSYFARLPGQDLESYVSGTLSLLKFILLDIGLALDAYFARSTEQISKALELYEQSNTELREFAHLASHDLKTPVATVAGLCEEFLDEFGSSVPDGARQLIETARNRTMKMRGMIEELLSMSEAAARPGARTRASSRSLIDEVLDRVRPEIGERQIQLNVPDQMPEIVTHPGRFREVFYQLLSNAVKFMDKDPGVVSVSVAQSQDEIIFCVSDNGPGIAEPDQAKIFAPFHRLPQHRHQAGSGLGLYFVRKIVEEKGGRVWVASKVGCGSDFYVAFPAQDQQMSL